MYRRLFLMAAVGAGIVGCVSRPHFAATGSLEKTDNMKRLIEVRSYKLKPGTASAFHQAMASDAIPMLRSWDTDVVAFGPSAHEADTYFLVRAYNDLADRNARQDAFYSSEAWLQGPRESIVSRIESYLNTVLWLSAEAVEDLRRSNVFEGA